MGGLRGCELHELRRYTINVSGLVYFCGITVKDAIGTTDIYSGTQPGGSPRL